jgi:hypothetical protein
MMQLIPQWRRAWRFLSMQFAALAMVWLALPADAQAAVLRLLPGMTSERLAGALILAGMIGRLIVQPRASP